MKVHELKIFSDYFDALKNRSKTFEIRYNDRDYKVNEVLYLKEIIEKDLISFCTGREIKAKVTYILDNEMYLQPGYICMGIIITAILDVPKRANYEF